MLFKSEVLTQASGSIGGVTYSRNRSGMYRRARAIPVNTNTAFQTEVRSALTALVNFWTVTLTDAQREAWNLYASNVPVLNPLGDPITLSGQNWYIACNAPRLQVNSKISGVTLPRVDDAPAIFDRGEFTTPVLDSVSVAGTIEIFFNNADAWASEPDSALLIYQGRPQNPSINFFKGPWRLVDALEGNATPPTSPLSIGALTYQPRGWPVANDQKQWIKVSVTRDDGRLTTSRIIGPVLSTV